VLGVIADAADGGRVLGGNETDAHGE
jgi:hypothetical protein